MIDHLVTITDPTSRAAIAMMGDFDSDTFDRWQRLSPYAWRLFWNSDLELYVFFDDSFNVMTCVYDIEADEVIIIDALGLMNRRQYRWFDAQVFKYRQGWI